MTIKFTYSQFLFHNGVPRKQADAIGEKIASKVLKRELLTRDESALTAAYLNRPGANEVVERHVGVAILTSNSRGTVHRQSTSDLPFVPNASVLGFSNDMGTAKQSAGRRLPAQTPEWTNPRPGDPGNTSTKQKTQTVGSGKTITTTRPVVRALAARVAAN